MLTFDNIKIYNVKINVIGLKVEEEALNKELLIQESDDIQKLIESGKWTSRTYLSLRNKLLIFFDIKIPLYLFQQISLDYDLCANIISFIVNANLGKCYNKYVSESVKQEMDSEIACFISNPCYESYIQMISNCPMGTELTVRIGTSYGQLAKIYKNQDWIFLKEDYRGFVHMVKMLPFSNILIPEAYKKKKIKKTW